MVLTDIALDEISKTLTDTGILVLELIGLAVVGYVLGYLVSNVIQRVLKRDELGDLLAGYGAATKEFWGSTVNFIAQYSKWYITVAVLSAINIGIITSVLRFLTQIFWFIILAVVGLLLGGILQKFIKDAIIAVGIEAEMAKHRLSDSIGGVPISSIISGIAKWYIVLIFLEQGVARLELPGLTSRMNALLNYIPNAILGILVIIVALIIADFAGSRIKQRKVGFAEILALGAEIIIVFFGAVLALPKFGIRNVSILEDSFKILAIGVSIGIAIAVGLGLKDSISKASLRYEEEIIEKEILKGKRA